MVYLPTTKAHLNGHAYKPGYADTSRVTHTGRAQTKLSVLLGYIVCNFGKGADVDQPAQ